mgnify:CR=1 FL=1
MWPAAAASSCVCPKTSSASSGEMYDDVTPTITRSVAHTLVSGTSPSEASSPQGTMAGVLSGVSASLPTRALKKMGVYYTMSEQLVKHLFDEIDTNGNGVIEKNEWMEFMDHFRN